MPPGIASLLAPGPRPDLTFHRKLVAEDIVRRVHGEPLHLFVVEAEVGAPEWLHDRSVLLHDLLELGHHRLALLQIDRPFGLVQELVEFGVRIAALIPRNTRAIGEAEHHDAERAMIPNRAAERHLHPYIPILLPGHDADLDPDAGLLPLLDRRLRFGAVPGRILGYEELGVEAARIAGIGEQLLGCRYVAFEVRELGIVGLSDGDVVMLARDPEPAERHLNDRLRVDCEPHRLADARVVIRL